MLIDTGRRITALGIISIVTGSGPERRMVVDIFKQHNKIIEGLIGVEFSRKTWQRYDTACTHLQNYIKFKTEIDIDGVDMELRDVNYDFIQQYYYWLRAEKKHSYNTAVKYLSLFKTIIIQCRKKGWLYTDPFADFKTSPKDIPVIPLRRSGVYAIQNKVFFTDRLNAVRDIFIFSCYTGLAYIDIKNLMRSQIEIDDEGNKWILSSRQKNDAPIKVLLLRVAEELLDKYATHPKCLINGFVLPVASNQKMNEYLKEITALCGINRRLTFHIARHTFATTITLANGVPIETVSKLLGHSRIKQTQHYAKVIDTKAREDMQELDDKLAPKQTVEIEFDFTDAVAKAS
ncbi:site-specific integrase [Pedobacter sp. MR22-3]|uniref:site-specific integrase n=1 Tax=Pedobacter sp. MR22-3 TaxID=2994552 RepID=UPI002246B8B4|nr:site-specific integrase [Pedobacter sp. MR22-3]MCX2583956.1 site-specific integrase [Pedobacter sp. MR22-3]